ncbi:MAG TPA: DUF1289 domain-containing protein [Rhodobacteraceae bacterium]|nr:DUF1289 domain-containing protein [Paracoccaceae bacterium]
MDDGVWVRDEVSSPCVKLCVIHPEAELCTGCFRSLDEIAQWSKMTDAKRQEVMAELPARKPLIVRRRGGRKGRL